MKAATWQSVMAEPFDDRQSETDRGADRGTFQSACLVTNYFAVETRTSPQRAWRAPLGGRPTLERRARLRRRLSDLREAFGLSYIGRQYRPE